MPCRGYEDATISKMYAAARKSDTDQLELPATKGRGDEEKENGKEEEGRREEKEQKEGKKEREEQEEGDSRHRNCRPQLN